MKYFTHIIHCLIFHDNIADIHGKMVLERLDIIMIFMAQEVARQCNSREIIHT
jgi:hypothetical protein